MRKHRDSLGLKSPRPGAGPAQTPRVPQGCGIVNSQAEGDVGVGLHQAALALASSPAELTARVCTAGPAEEICCGCSGEMEVAGELTEEEALEPGLEQ